MYSYIIIDDEALIREGTKKKLTALNDMVTCIGEANNGAEGIKLIEKLHPDIVILDMQMPIMDGTKLLPYLAEHYPGTPLIVISGYRDFDYIKHAISAKAVDYILKPFSREDVQKSMRDAIAQLEESISMQNLLTTEEKAESHYYDYDIQMLQNMIMGYHTQTTTLTSKKLSFINDTHNLLLLTMHFAKAVPGKQIQDFLSENSFGDLALYLRHATSEQLSFIVLFVPEDASISNQHLASQISEAVISFLAEQGINVTIGISDTHRSLLELHDAFLETATALNSMNIKETTLRYYFFVENKDPVFIHWEYDEEFLFRIEAGMQKEVEQMINDLFLFYRSLPECTLADVKYHCYELGNQCRIVMNYYLKQAAPENESSSIQNITNHIFSLKELQNYYQQFFLNLTNILKPQSVYAVDNVIEKIKIYMNRNYQKNLNQEFIASLFYLNRSYLSHLFKSQTGEKFVDYLNHIRIEKSKELLAKSDRKMYQIARLVGYDNIKYFFRVFKKYEGMTPEQFRNTNG